MKPAIIALALAASASAHAESFFQVEAGMGAASYGTTDGKWYQAGAQDNRTSTTAPALSVGLTGAVISRESWGIDWHADAVYIGSVSASCQCTVSDADYNTATKTVRAGAITESYHGSGHVAGASLTVEPYYAYSGWKFGAVGGVFAYRKTWTEDVSGWSGAPSPVHLESSHRISVAPVIGADISRGNVTLSYRYYMTSRNEGHVPPLWDDIQTLETTYRY
jgi:hypothetical protein